MADPQITLEKLDKLKQAFFNADIKDKQQIAEWEGRVKRALIAQKLFNHPTIQDVISYATDRIEECNQLLQEHRSLTDSERAIIFERRDAYEWFVKLFDVQGNIDDVDSNADANLEHAANIGVLPTE